MARFKLRLPTVKPYVDVRPQTVKTDDIILLEDLRSPLDKEHVKALVKTIRRDGLQEPIIVKMASGIHQGRLVVVDGAHRLLACRMLQMKSVPVKVVTKAHSVGLEQIKNLYNKRLCVLDFSLELVKYATKKALADQPANPVGGRQPHDKGHSRIAKQTGFTPKRVAQAFAHSKLASGIQLRVRSGKFQDNLTVLNKLTKLSRAEQVKFLESRSRGSGVKSKSDKAKSVTATLRAAKQSWAKSDVKMIFDGLPNGSKRLFQKWLLA